MNRLLTIVMPVWNREATIGRTLMSIRDQGPRLSRCRLVIVDNNSTDNSMAAAHAAIDNCYFEGLETTFVQCTRQGAPAARNVGVEQVDTPWIMHFDSDDIMERGLIGHTIGLIESDAFDADVISWNVRVQTVGGNMKICKGALQKDILLNHICHSTFASQRYAIRTPFLRRAGGWNESCDGWDDLELGCRIAALQPRIEHFDKVFATTILSPNSITEPKFSRNPDKWEHALDVIDSDVEAIENAPLWVDLRRIILAAEYFREGDRKRSDMLLNTTLSKHPAGISRGLRFLYHKHRITPRGTCMMAKWLLPKPEI